MGFLTGPQHDYRKEPSRRAKCGNEFAFCSRGTLQTGPWLVLVGSAGREE